MKSRTFWMSNLVLGLTLGSMASYTSADSHSYNHSGIYQMQLRIAGIYANHLQSFSEYDALIPLWQNYDNLIFSDLRYLDRIGKPGEGNFGIGVRHLNPAQNNLIGAYLFYDRMRSPRGNYFNQLTLGGEFKTLNWRSDGNVYIPVGRKSVGTGSLDSIQLISGDNPYGFQNIAIGLDFEKTMAGLDAEVGHTLPFLPGGEFYAGAYYYHAKNVPTVAGPHLRFTYDISRDLFQHANTLPATLTFDSGYTHDRVRGNNVYAGIRATLVLDDHLRTQLSSMQEQMTQYVRRDFDIISGTGNGGNTLLKDANGDLVTVGIATNEDQLDTAVTHNASVIAVRGDITGINTVQLRPSQTITGGNYVFNYQNQTYTLPVSNGGSLTVAPGQTTVILNNQNNTIRDITLNAVDIFPDKPPVAITNVDVLDPMNPTFNPIGNLVVDGVQTNGVIFEAMENQNNVTMSFTNNRFVNHSTHNVSGDFPIGFIYIVGYDSNFHISNISNNVFDLEATDPTQESLSAVNILVDLDNETATSHVTIDNVQGNQISLNNADIAIGFLLATDGLTQVTVNNFSNNQMNFGNNINTADFGLYSFGITSSKLTINNLTNNTMTTNTLGIFHFGINVGIGDDANMEINGFSGNQFNLAEIALTNVSTGSLVVNVDSNNLGLSAANNNAIINPQGAVIFNPSA